MDLASAGRRDAELLPILHHRPAGDLDPLLLERIGELLRTNMADVVVLEAAMESGVGMLSAAAVRL